MFRRQHSGFGRPCGGGSVTFSRSRHHYCVGMTKRIALQSLALSAVLSLAASGRAQDRVNDSPRVPVLVELFTSEGCSSCPPADALLEKLAHQPVADAELIVLSEHVDYWNHDGWKDPYSSAAMSDRQRAYSGQFHLDTVYTPQMIVDGARQFSGGDGQKASAAISEALRHTKIPVRLSAILVEGNRLRCTVETDRLGSPSEAKSAELFVAAAQTHAESQVLHGENANRHLTHVAVARKISRVAKLSAGQQATQVELRLDTPVDPHNLRVIAFLRDPSSGRVVGAAMQTADVSSPQSQTR